MDCCHSSNDNSKKEMKGGSWKMDKKFILWIIIAVLILVVLYLVFKAGSNASGNTVIETANAAKSVVQSQASSGMVGGC